MRRDSLPLVRCPFGALHELNCSLPSALVAAWSAETLLRRKVADTGRLSNVVVVPDKRIVVFTVRPSGLYDRAPSALPLVLWVISLFEHAALYRRISAWIVSPPLFSGSVSRYGWFANKKEHEERTRA